MQREKTHRHIIKLSEGLEKAILHGVVKGLVAPSVVTKEELSALGGKVLVAIYDLYESGVAAPYPLRSLLLSITDVAGVPVAEATEYLRGVAAAEVGGEAALILQKVRDKQLLIDIINEAALQLQRGALDAGSFLALTHNTSFSNTLESVSERVKDGLPEPPQSFEVRSLPTFQKKAGGIIGVTALAGGPDLGKSTFAWQVALDVARTYPVIYYDFENGFPALMDRTREIFKGNLDAIRKHTEKVYVRESIRTLESDLSAIVPPALIVVDSIQKIPTSVEYRRMSLDKWIHRLESLKKRGYYVLLISEIGRGSYDRGPSIGAFKETGEIEYSADLGLQIVQGHRDTVELHIVKNRHRPYKGFVTGLTRERGFLLVEADQGPEPPQDNPQVNWEDIL